MRNTIPPYLPKLVRGELSSAELPEELDLPLLPVVYYSGHIGYVDDYGDEVEKNRPGQYALILNDGPLRAREIESVVENVSIAFINGCISAVSVDSLTGAFIRNGASLVIGTLFKVNPVGARLFAEKFYERIFAGETAGEALRIARITAKEDEACGAALYWATRCCNVKNDFFSDLGFLNCNEQPKRTIFRNFSTATCLYLIHYFALIFYMSHNLLIRCNPMNVILHLTDDCNLRCRYCLNQPMSLGPMPWEVAKRGIDLAISLSWGRVGVQFYGGEPLLEWELLRRCVEYASGCADAAGLECLFSLTTNGTRLTEEICRFLADISIRVSISIDGAPNTQDFYRPLADGRPSSPLVESGIRLALQQLPEVRAMTAVGPSTVAHLPENLIYLCGPGVRGFDLSFNYLAEWNKGDISALESSIKAIADLWIQRMLENNPISISILEEKIGVWMLGGYPSDMCCPVGRWAFSVTPDGKVYCCRVFTTNYPGCRPAIGDVWQGLCGNQHDTLLVAGMPRAERCKKCEVANRCMHFCRCSNLFTSGDPNVPGELLCRLQRATIREGERIGRLITHDLI